MNKEPYILIGEINKNNRKDFEIMESVTYSSVKDLIEGLYLNNLKNARIYNMSDFMDLCNDEDLDLNENWLGYVYVLVG